MSEYLVDGEVIQLGRRLPPATGLTTLRNMRMTSVRMLAPPERKSDFSGHGLLSGSFPLSLITAGGNLPTHSEIRILYRPEAGHPIDGVVVETSTCNADGSWQVSGLNENLKFDIVARIPGFNDVIISDVQPTGAPLSAHFANLKEEYEYEEEVEIQVVALGGKPPYTYTVLNLPDGLVFDPVTEMITGAIPSGDIGISIEVSDSSGDTTQVQWEGHVISPLPTVIGEFFQGGYYIGDIEDQGQMYKVLVAPIEADVYGLMWKTSRTNTPGTGSLTDGWSNTWSMNSAEHPAASHCLDYRGGGHDDWYMPAKDELNLFWLSIAPGKTQVPEFQYGGEQALDGSLYYWASTQYSDLFAQVQRFRDHTQDGKHKNRTDARVRPVRRLPFNP